MQQFGTLAAQREQNIIHYLQTIRRPADTGELRDITFDSRTLKTPFKLGAALQDLQKYELITTEEHRDSDRNITIKYKLTSTNITSQFGSLAAQREETIFNHLQLFDYPHHSADIFHFLTPRPSKIARYLKLLIRLIRRQPIREEFLDLITDNQERQDTNYMVATLEDLLEYNLITTETETNYNEQVSTKYKINKDHSNS